MGRKECRIGTNPLIVAIPSTPITMVDMSMSMFSYGMLEVNRLAGRQLPVDGGFDDEGNLTKEPGVIEKNRRILPMGYWKGSGMSIVLDMIATLLSDGASVAEVTEDNSDEYGISQILLPLKWTSLSTVPPAMPNCNALWITLPVPSVLTKIRPFAYPATNLLPCWQKTAVTVLPLMTACGQKSRRYKEISHDFWTYRAA